MAYSSSCKITGNSLTSSPYANGKDCGIVVQNTAGDIHVSDNALYHFPDDRSIITGKYNVKVINNTYFDGAEKFDPLAPAIYLSNTSISEGDSTIICIPDLDVPLENNEEFYLYVPDDYNSVMLTRISYNSMIGVVTNGDTTSNVNLSRYAGRYARLKYIYYSDETGERIQFAIIL